MFWALNPQMMCIQTSSSSMTSYLPLERIILSLKPTKSTHKKVTDFVMFACQKINKAVNSALGGNNFKSSFAALSDESNR